MNYKNNLDYFLKSYPDILGSDIKTDNIYQIQNAMVGREQSGNFFCRI